MLIQENEKAPAFKLPIYVKNIHKGKHGSDSGVYDANGRYPIQISICHHHHVKNSGFIQVVACQQVLVRANHLPLYFTESRQVWPNKQ